MTGIVRIGILSGIMLLFSMASYPQNRNTADFLSQIKLSVSDSTSKYYYPVLLEKVKNTPADIDLADCLYLYYGKLFQRDRHRISLFDSDYRDFTKAHITGKRKKTMSIGEKILLKNPADLVVLLHMSMCIINNNLPDNNFVEQRLKNTLDAILSTGDGKSFETAFKIADIEHDQIIKGIFGFLGGKEYLESYDNSSYSVWDRNGEKMYFEDLWVTAGYTDDGE